MTAMVQNCGRKLTGKPHTGVREPQTQQGEQSPPLLADKGVYILLPRTREYVTLPGKTDFTDRIKLKDSEMGRLSWLVWMGPNKVYESSKGENLSRLWTENQTKDITCCEYGGTGPRDKNRGQPEMARKQILS